MILEQQEYIDKIAQNVVATKRVIKQDLLQRRNQVTDLNGVYFYAQGGSNVPAAVRIGISPDMVYMQRFEFKLIISPFMGTGGTTPDIHPVPVTASDFRVKIEGVDISAYLAAQHDGWISGEGIWPGLGINQVYDVLEAACDLRSDGRIDDANKLVHAGYKNVEITSASLFAVAIQLWMKYPNSNR